MSSEALHVVETTFCCGFDSYGEPPLGSLSPLPTPATACRNDHAHLVIASSAVDRGKVLLEVGVGHFGEILLQLSHDLVLARRIERVAKFIATAAHFWNGVTLAWVETNGQAAVLVSRDDVPVALTTIDASAQGIDQIMWILRPSKLVGISNSDQRLGHVPGPAAA